MHVSENEGGLWTLQVTVTEFDGLIVSVYCQVNQKLSLVSERWYGHGCTSRTGCYGPVFLCIGARLPQAMQTLSRARL